jgi:hypothetical protein
MPEALLTGSVITAVGAVGAVVATAIIIALTRLIVRFAAEPLEHSASGEQSSVGARPVTARSRPAAR